MIHRCIVGYYIGLGVVVGIGLGRNIVVGKLPGFAESADVVNVDIVLIPFIPVQRTVGMRRIRVAIVTIILAWTVSVSMVTAALAVVDVLLFPTGGFLPVRVLFLECRPA